MYIQGSQHFPQYYTADSHDCPLYIVAESQIGPPLNIADSRHFPLYITADSHDYPLYIWRKVIKRKMLKNRSAIYIADSRHCPLYNMAASQNLP
jgi:hypothetical protein